MDELKELLILSKPCRESLVLILLNSSTEAALYFETLNAMFFPYFFGFLGSLPIFPLAIRAKLTLLFGSLGYFILWLALSQVKLYQFRYGLWKTFKRETDQENREVSSQTLRESFEEYLNKTQRLKHLLTMYSNRKQNEWKLKQHYAILPYYSIEKQREDCQRFQQISSANQLSYFDIFK